MNGMEYSQIDSSGIIPLTKRSGEWRVFLIQYRGYEQFWGCPKGHLESKETHKEAARRELKEETNLEVLRFINEKPILEEFHWVKNGKRRHKRVLFYLAEVVGDVCLQKEEIVGGEWLSLPEAIEKVAHQEGKATLRKAQRLIANDIGEAQVHQ
jgi:8-oxo-dGTP pyrophosphatase MutT (NUDIX family)